LTRNKNVVKNPSIEANPAPFKPNNGISNTCAMTQTIAPNKNVINPPVVFLTTI